MCQTSWYEIESKWNILFWSKVLAPGHRKCEIWAQNEAEVGVKNRKYAIFKKIVMLEC